ncbi:MAG: winged helix-turn-helix domain-containing protein, partial [Hyphomicrobiales bacterium]
LQQVRKGLATRQEMADAMLARIAEGGPVRSSDFERTEGQKGGGWWDWKDEKLVLELLFSAGELMVARRRNFQRVYDLRERVRPGADENLPTLDEANRALARESVRAMGIARRAWVPGYLFHYELRTVALKATAELVKDGELLEVEVEGWPEPGVVHPDNSALLEAVREAGYEHSRTEVLSPFDPVTWDRARAFELFGFDYKIECYTPAPKRVYGYFTLPILHDGQLVGRLDPKAHRKLGVFEVKSVHLEPWVSVTHELVTELKDTLRRCAKWHGTPELVVRAANGPGLAEALGRG